MLVTAKNEIQERAFVLAMFHGVFIPLILAFLTYAVESSLTIVSSIVYLVFVSLMHLYRLFFNNDSINLIKAYEFIRVLGYVALVALLFLIVILLLSF